MKHHDRSTHRVIIITQNRSSCQMNPFEDQARSLVTQATNKNPERSVANISRINHNIEYPPIVMLNKPVEQLSPLDLERTNERETFF